jgi:cysteine desulfurase/selenocysteine lyase
MIWATTVLKMDIAKIREDFPTTSKLVYLATCGAAPTLKPMLDAIKNAWNKKSEMGEILCGTVGMLQTMGEGRECAARIIGANADEIAFVRGNNDAMNIIASMLDWRKGDNVILNDMEYAGGVLPWMRQRRPHGIEVKCVKSDQGAISLNTLENAIDDHTRVISICHVHTANGYRNDLEELGNIARTHGIYLVVNASQSLGAMKVDVEKMNIDFLTCSTYKWAIAPPGTGLMYVRKEHIEELEPPFVGIGQEFRSQTNPNFNYHEYNPRNLSKTARKFEYGGHQMATGIIGLVESLKYLRSIGIDEITRRDTILLEHLIGQLSNFDVELPSWIEDKSHRSAFIGLSSRVPVKELHDSLREENIVTITRRGYMGKDLLRVAPHFFNTKEEIDIFTEAFSKLLEQ